MRGPSSCNNLQIRVQLASMNRRLSMTEIQGGLALSCQIPTLAEISFSDKVCMNRNNRSALLHVDSDSPTLCRARREAVLRQATQGADGDGQYKGMNSYVDYHKGFRREHTIGSEKGSGGCCRAIALHERWATCEQIKGCKFADHYCGHVPWTASSESLTASLRSHISSLCRSSWALESVQQCADDCTL